MIEFYQDDYFKLAMKLIQNYTLMGIKTNNDSGSSGILINAGAPESFKDIFKIPEPTWDVTSSKYFELKPILISSFEYANSISSIAEPVSGLFASNVNLFSDNDILTDLDLSEKIVETLSTDSENLMQSKLIRLLLSLGITFS